MLPARLLDADSLRPRLWDALFNDATPVVPFAFDEARDRNVVSFRTREATAIVKRTYQTIIAASPATIPGALESARMLDELKLPDDGDVSRFLAEHRIERWRQKAAGIVAGPGPRPAHQTLKDFALYYRMPQPAVGAPDTLPRTPEELREILDFHGAVTALSAHPSLMRALGLVLDVSVDAQAVGFAGLLGAPFGVVSVDQFETARGFRAVRLMMPGVMYQHRPASAGVKGLFATADMARPGIVEGYLELTPQSFHLVDVDLEGALAKLTSLATLLLRASRSPTADGALPALRSGGLSLAVHDRGREVVEALERAAEINTALTAPAAAADLSARDVARGYRVDVWSSATGRWASLHQRSATYTFGEAGDVEVNVREEGFTQLAAASPERDPTRPPVAQGPPIETDLYVHEALARWTGWSLSAPRFERPIHRSDEQHPLAADPSSQTLATAFKMRQRFEPAPGTLPSLRFGRRYRMRVRVVDLAGNSPLPNELDVHPEAAGPQGVALPRAPEAQPYFRYEPVPHPLLVLRSVPQDRRPAVDRIVIRSFNNDPSLDAVATGATDERHIAPPRTAVDLAERHGMFDDAAGRLKGDAATFASLVARNDAPFATEMIGDPPRETPIERGARLAVRYLPDPLARTAAFRFLPGIAPGRVAIAGVGGLVERALDGSGEAGPVLQVYFGEEWPDREAFRLVLADGARAPVWDRDERVLTVFVPKATDTEVRLSSGLSDADLELMGVWAWEREHLTALADSIVGGGPSLAGRLDQHARLSALLLRLALEGGQWALTPSIPLRLIHAVQQPLGRPAFVCGGASTLVPRRVGDLRDSRRSAGREAALIAQRALGSPDATLIGALDVHLPSTGRVDLIGSWADVIDERDATDGFVRAPGQSAAEVIRLDRSSGSIPAQGVDRRDVAVIVNAERIAFVRERFENGALQPAAAPIHRFGDTRHRRVTYRAVSTSRFQADFPSDPNLRFTRDSAPVVVVVPNSAPPAAPRIVQVLPTFGWQRERSGTLASSVRSGRGVRVYLERPWYTSGEGELLGVVLWRRGAEPPGAEDRRDRLAGFVTEWGLDPVRRSGILPPMPTLDDLIDPAASMESVHVADARFEGDVAGYRVHSDGALWYADVTLRSDAAYMPFLRLALARFQPDSIADAEISPVASAGFIQLTPDRSAVLIADHALRHLYRLVVSGVGPLPSQPTPWRNSIEVTIQERRDDITGDLAWREVTPGTATVTPIVATTEAPAVLFSGLIEFAGAPPAGRYRLVIREYETWQVDRAAAGGLADILHLASPRPAAPAGAPLAALQIGGPAASADWQGTGRALERLGIAMVGPATGRRLVYAEYMTVDPAALPLDSSLVAPERDGAILEPGADLLPDDPDQQPVPWPSRPARPPLDFRPSWDEIPDAEPEAFPQVVSGTVKLAQAMLNSAVSLQPPLAIDGLFGAGTEAAVRAFRAAAFLPDAGGLDAQSWIALAGAAPFPTLEAGPRQPSMTGPPILFVQMLLNQWSDADLLTENGIYTPEMADRVGAFQVDRGLPNTGIVDLDTWREIARLFDAQQPAGVERVTLGFDRGRIAGGGPPLVLIARQPLEAVARPASDPVDESWVERTGLWAELQDSRDQPIFRIRIGNPLAAGGDEQTISVVLPVLAAARRLVVFGTTAPNDYAAAVPLAIFQPW